MPQLLTLSGKMAFFSFLFLVMSFFYALLGEEILLKDFYETPYGNICLNEIIHPTFALKKEDQEKAKRFCQIITPPREKTYNPQELEIFFYQAGFFPVKIRQKLTIKPILRKLTIDEKNLLNLNLSQEIYVPREAKFFATGKELFIYGQNQEVIPYYQYYPSENFVAAQTPVEYIWETKNFLFQLKGKLNHRARIGDKVSVQVLGKNRNGILVDRETVKGVP